MSFEVQSKGGVQDEVTEGGPSTCVGIPTVNLATNEVELFYDIDPPSRWRRFLVFSRGLIFGITLYFCCPAPNRTSDDLTWGHRLFVAGAMVGGAIGGVIIGFSSSYLGCWVGSEIAVSFGDESDNITGCRVGGWCCLAVALCFMILGGIRRIPKAVFRTAYSAVTNNDEPELESLDSN